MKSDPKSSQHIIPFKTAIASAGEPQPEWFSFLSVMCAMLGFMLRVKWAAWVSLLFFLSGFSCSKSSSAELSQMFTSFMMIILSLVTNYSYLFRSA